MSSRTLSPAGRARRLGIEALSLAVALVVFVVPFVFIVLTALKDEFEASDLTFSLPTTWPVLQNVKDVFAARDGMLIVAFKNSTIVTVVAVAALVVLCAMVAFVLQRRPGRVATKLMSIVGLTLAGGILLLWVCWKLWRELRSGGHDHDAEAEAAGFGSAEGGKTLGQALWQIIIADVSMSLDNVLAVAGTARDHTGVLIIGLALSVALMGVAANFVANILKRAPWIAYVGLAVIAWVALRMVWDGGLEMFHFADEAGAF